MGQTPTSYTAEGTSSDCPLASSTWPRAGTWVITARRAPGPSWGLMTLGAHCTFQPEPARRSANWPGYVHWCPPSPRFTEAEKWASAVSPLWSTRPMDRNMAVASSWVKAPARAPDTAGAGPVV